VFGTLAPPAGSMSRFFVRLVGLGLEGDCLR
jgi:hypothetical protein